MLLSSSQRDRLAMGDNNLGSTRGLVQTRIDIGSWTQKGRNEKQAIGSTWEIFFHTAGIAGRKADNPYFVSIIRETQKWGERVPSPSGREIDDKYLDTNEADIREKMRKFKME